MAQVRLRFEAWRERIGGRGGRGKPIPEVLWSEAVDVARIEGASATARALRLNATRLVERMGAAEPEKSTGASDFVELDVAGLWRSDRMHTVLRFMGRDGERLRIDVTNAKAVDLVDVALAFWSRQG